MLVDNAAQWVEVLEVMTYGISSSEASNVKVTKVDKHSAIACDVHSQHNRCSLCHDMWYKYIVYTRSLK